VKIINQAEGADNGGYMEAYLTIKEVAGILKLSVQTIRRYVMKGEIPHHKINRTVRFKSSEIQWWVENRRAFTVCDIQETNGGKV
jgi:excisionase family DNA binding protein